MDSDAVQAWKHQDASPYTKKCWVKYNPALSKYGQTQRLGSFDPVVGLLPRSFG